MVMTIINKGTNPYCQHQKIAFKTDRTTVTHVKCTGCDLLEDHTETG